MSVVLRWCSGFLDTNLKEEQEAAQSGQALWPFESQIPGSNPGRSILLFKNHMYIQGNNNNNIIHLTTTSDI